MKCIVTDGCDYEGADLYYRESDFSFDTDPLIQGGHSSIAIDFLQIQITSEGQLLYVWGYCPLVRYQETKEFPKSYSVNRLFAVVSKVPEPGTAMDIDRPKEWPTFVNKIERWVCIGNPITQDVHMFKFGPGCVATLDDDNELIAVWLHPIVTGKPPKVGSAFTAV